MEPKETLPETVVEDSSIALARKINSMTRQTHYIKAKAAKEKKLKKRLAAIGPGGGVGHGGRSGHRGRSHMGAPTLQTTSWPENYKSMYYYAPKQLEIPIGKVPYITDVIVTPLFFEFSSS